MGRGQSSICVTGARWVCLNQPSSTHLPVTSYEDTEVRTSVIFVAIKIKFEAKYNCTPKSKQNRLRTTQSPRWVNAWFTWDLLLCVCRVWHLLVRAQDYFSNPGYGPDHTHCTTQIALHENYCSNCTLIALLHFYIDLQIHFVVTVLGTMTIKLNLNQSTRDKRAAENAWWSTVSRMKRC